MPDSAITHGTSMVSDELSFGAIKILPEAVPRTTLSLFTPTEVNFSVLSVPSDNFIAEKLLYFVVSSFTKILSTAVPFIITQPLNPSTYSIS